MYINIKDLTYSIDNKQILNDISLHMEKGEFVGVIGPNGSGKSTFLKNIYKILKPNDGCVYINEKDVLKMNNRDFANEVAVVAQENSSSFDFSVQDIILMGRYSKKKLFEGSNKKDLELVKNALNTVGMKNFEKRSFSRLSGGEKQRILIARAIVQETEVLILDEPTNHLDIGSQIKTLKLLKRSNKTILTALHDLNIAARYCDKIFVIHGGKIIRSGKPMDILDEELIKTLYDIESEVIINGNYVSVNYL